MAARKWTLEFPGGEYELVNMMEEAVKQKVVQLTADIDMCRCQKCLMDISALALNNLPGQYATSLQGRLYSRVPQMAPDFGMTLAVQVAKAIETVRTGPRHDKIVDLDPEPGTVR